MSRTPTYDLVHEACALVAHQLQYDATAALNEAEFQALLQHALRECGPAYVPASLGPGVLRRAHHPELMVQRVFRELKLDGGRAGKEADIVILRDGPQVVEAKHNGAPARFRGPFAAIIETKIDDSAIGMLSGRRVRARQKDLLADLEKWRSYSDEHLVDAVFAVVLTADPAAYAGLDNVITVRRSASAVLAPGGDELVDPWPAIDAALNEIADEYRQFPLAFLREKDFETQLMMKLRSAKLPRSKMMLPSGAAVSIDPVRAQWSGDWSSILQRGRRHDLIVLDTDGTSLLAELELKTSHSDSHNWFRKREVAGELEAMHQLVEGGKLKRGRLVMFRYGAPMWEADAEQLFARYPHVEFAYYGS